MPNLKEKNLYVADFFNEDALCEIKKIQFDFILGNPPWGQGGELQKAYFKKYKLMEYNYRNDTCRAFIFRARDFCSENTKCCFVLHSKMLYLQKAPSIKFREFLLKSTKISRIVELSSVRKLVFKNANAPAVILSYSFSNNAPLNNRFEYISMKPNLFFRLFNIIVVEKTDVKYVQQKLLAENDWAWKTLVYGLSGDFENILSLKSIYPALEDTIKQRSSSILKGEGVEYHSGDKKPAHHLIGLPLIDSDTSIDHFIFNEHNSEIFAKTEIHRPRKAALFKAPYCLVKKGLDLKDYTMRAVFAEIDVVYKDAIYAIKGSLDHKDFLLGVTGLLNSKLYAYFNLMLGSSLGIEREQRHIEEVLKFPFASCDYVARQVERVQKVSRLEDFAVCQDVTGEIEKLNKMILEAFDLANNLFVDYALNVTMPWLANSDECKAFKTVNQQQLSAYVKPFLEALSAVYGMSGRFVTAKIYPTVARYYSVVEVVLRDNKPSAEIQIMDDFTSAHAALTRFAADKINDMFFTVKDVIHFDEDSFYIIKANYYKNWHPAIAAIDLADATHQILSRNRGNE